MPLIEVTLGEGRSPEQLRSLISALTKAAHEAVDAPVDSIRVVLREVPLTHWAAGDVTLAERRAGTTPVAAGTAQASGPEQASDTAEASGPAKARTRHTDKSVVTDQPTDGDTR